MRVIERIRLSAQQYAEREAVRDPDGCSTYARLWKAAEAVAEGLPSAGPGVVVLREPRSRRLISRLLGVWLAGHAPLLLDPVTPCGRIEEIVSDVSPLGVFEESGFHALLVPYREARGVEYLISTSGTSGRARVIEVEDGSLDLMLGYQIEAFQIGPRSRSLWILSPGFDAGLSDIGTALCSGAALVCGQAESLLPILVDQSITHLDIPPSLLQLYRPGEFPSSLETLVVGGEPSPPEVLRAWSEHHRVVAVYGPSETTVCSSLSQVDSEWDETYIGQPLPCVQYRVEGGELSIGGPLVARGYVNGDNSPFFRRDGVRWYRTGDLVAPGSDRHGLRFAGRKDRQVQWNGRRLEPGELEIAAARLLGHSDVAAKVGANAVTLFWRAGLLPDEERSLLRDRLEPWLAPLEYRAVSKIPRTTSGKIDYARLQAQPALPSEIDSIARLDLKLKLERLAPGAEGALAGDYLARCAPKIVPRSRSRRGKTLLVTGSSGRLGRALIPLLDEYEVWSLTRNPQPGRHLRGDVSLPGLGLSLDEWKFLSENVDEVVHLAAEVDFSRSLAELYPSNVAALSRLSRLGGRLHYASTLAVNLCARPVLSPHDGSEPELLFGGYAQSKWVGEQALRTVPGVTLRYGHLVGELDGRDLLGRVVRGLIESGCYPRTSRDPALVFDVTPLQWAARRTAELIRGVSPDRTLQPVRRGWHLHFLDLAELLEEEFEVRPVDPVEFFGLKIDNVARQALWRCDPTTRRGSFYFDLFLWGNLGLTSPSTPQARNYLARLLTAAAEPTAPPGSPVQTESRTRPSV